MRTLLCTVVFSALLAACGGGGAGTTSSAPTTTASTVAPIAPTNVVPVVVDSGPGGNSVNVLYTTVTVCHPGSQSQCQTIDHVLLDTGSTGLRLLSSVLSPSLSLSASTGASGFPLLNCLQFLDTSFTWGPVVSADVVFGANTASNVSIQVIADPKFTALSSACATGLANDSVGALGAKGVLGVGLFKEDCGQGCTSAANNGVYYTCTSATCQRVAGTTVSLSKQIKNPVVLLAHDNNGVVIDLPSVAGSGANSVAGSMYLGIGTQSNNQVGAASVLTTDGNGYIATTFAGRNLATSFLDTGSNGLYFDSTTIALCTDPKASGYFCPATAATLTATNAGLNGVKATVSFGIDNATTQLANTTYFAFPRLAGPINDFQTFDWGLPFFFGRRVFIGIEGQSSNVGPGPFFAF